MSLQTVKNEEIRGLVDGAPTVALLFTPIHELFNEPIWRAFFEAAGTYQGKRSLQCCGAIPGELRLRVESPVKPYISFIHGRGEKLFERISNEVWPSKDFSLCY